MAMSRRREMTEQAGAADCQVGRTLNIVAHADDDTLFLNPDIYRDIQAGRCVTTVYVTASDDNQGVDYWRALEGGPQAAHAYLAGVPDTWVEHLLTIAGHPVICRTLAGRPGVNILFLRLPDGNVDGGGFPATGFESLRKLLMNDIAEVHAIDRSSSYSKQELIELITAIMELYQPDIIRTQDYVNRPDGGDHSDHYMAARVVQQAHLAYSTLHEIAYYLGHSTSSLPANLSPAETLVKQSAFLAYAAHDPLTCQSPEECDATGHSDWFARQYRADLLRSRALTS